MEGLMVHAGAEKIGRQDLLALPTPPGTATHRPIAHHLIVEALIESLGFRRIIPVREEYAVTADGNRMFGVMDLNVEEKDIRFSIAVRNSHDKSFAMGLTCGFRVFCCDNLAFNGEFSPVMRKHTKRADHVEIIGGAVDKMQRHWKPITEKIDVWQNHSLPDNDARLLIYRAFVEGGTTLPKHLLKEVHREYFEPQFEEFKPRTMWSLQNGFTSAIKKLDPIPGYQALGEIGRFFNALN